MTVVELRLGELPELLFPRLDPCTSGVETQTMLRSRSDPRTHRGAFRSRGAVDRRCQISRERDRPFLALSHDGTVAQAVGQRVS